MKNLVELLAAIPSVVYGIWGLVLVIPLIRPGCNWLHEQLDWIPFFGTSLTGPRAAARRHRAGDHDPADGHGDQPRRAGGRSAANCVRPRTAWVPRVGRRFWR